MYELGTGEYTVVFELYFPSASIDHPQLTYQPQVVLRHFAGYQINKSVDHTRSLVHMHKYDNVTPNYLMMDLVLKNKSGVGHALD